MLDKIENETNEAALRHAKILDEAAAFDDISDEELEARITKDSSKGTSGSC